MNADTPLGAVDVGRAIFVGQADFRTPLDRAKQAILADDLESLSVEDALLHAHALEIFAVLEKDESNIPLLTQYCEVLEAADFRLIASSLQQVQGLEQVAELVKGNFYSQSDRLLIGAQECKQKGRVGIQYLGTYKTFSSQDEIVHALTKMQEDMDGVKELIIEHAQKGEPLDPLVLVGRLEKYSFDTSEETMNRKAPSSILVLTLDKNEKFFDAIKAVGIIPDGASIRDATSEIVHLDKGDVMNVYYTGGVTRRNLQAKVELARSGDMETGNLLLSAGAIPETVIVHVPSPDLFKSYAEAYTYQSLLVDWWRLPEKERPQIIMYTEGFTPKLYLKHDYQGFLFCSTPDELRSVYDLAQQLRQNQQSELSDLHALEMSQKDAYDNSQLREWEGRTASTLQSLRHIFRRFQYRNSLLQAKDEDRYSKLFDTDAEGNVVFHTGLEHDATPIRPITTVVDFGAGEGREDIPLAMEGYNIMALDISKKQLRNLKRRLIEEVQGLRGEKPNATLSYNELILLKKEGVLAEEPESDVDIVSKRLLTVQGSFFSLQKTLNQAVRFWSNKYRNTNMYDFFQQSRWWKPRFTEKENVFVAMGFDAAMFNWHTFCEVGSKDKQKMVLEQVLNVLQRGGELIIEIPDRQMEPYASALRKYHQDHSDEPYGTIRDPKPKNFKGLKGVDEYPPRYFSDINELILLLKSVGYEIDPEADVQSYMIDSFKEYFITARKSKY